MQSHLETTAAAADAILTLCRGELVDGTYIQSEAAMRGVALSTYAAINALMADVLNYLTLGVA